ncbi:MAG TPA: hypothetical protein VD867_18790, partial [Burkholderiales bacterium]|nr:hypothetical protein [Burkholderiales bacterium]
KLPTLLSALCLVAAGCAQLQPGAESPAYAARMKDAGDAYLACVTRESEKDMKNPTGAEDIANAAHGRCWDAWVAYRDATNASFAHGARTGDEIQFAQDKAEAHLRQFEREARRAIVDAVAARSLQGGPSKP